MSESGKADDETDPQQEIAVDLRSAFGEVGAPEIQFQRQIVELEAGKSALQLRRVRRSRRRVAASMNDCYRLLGD